MGRKDTMLTLNVGGNPQIQNLIECYQAWSRSHAWEFSTHVPRLSSHTNGIPVYNWWDTESINQSNSAVIAVDFSEEHALAMKGHAAQWRTDRYYIIFSASHWPDQSLPVDCAHTLVYWPSVLVDIVSVHCNPTQPYYYHKKVYDWNYPKPYIFSHVSGTQRWHRDWMLENLLPNLEKPFVFRYQGKDFGIDVANIDLLRQQVDPMDIAKYFQSFPDRHSHRVHARSLALPTYESAYFSLILETVFNHEQSVTITEKTARNLLTGQPFVISATPGHLKHLRDMGFETYHTLWDESYDTIQDRPTRISAVAELVKSLQYFDWLGHQEQLMAIGRHNRDVFTNWHGFVSTLFERLDATVDGLDKVLGNG